MHLAVCVSLLLGLEFHPVHTILCVPRLSSMSLGMPESLPSYRGTCLPSLLPQHPPTTAFSFLPPSHLTRSSSRWLTMCLISLLCLYSP